MSAVYICRDIVKWEMVSPHTFAEMVRCKCNQWNVNRDVKKIELLIELCHQGGVSKTLQELLNLRALKILPVNKKYTSFNVWVRYFVWNFRGYLWNSTQNILPIHWNITILWNIEIWRALRVKSSYAFLKRPCCLNRCMEQICVRRTTERKT